MESLLPITVDQCNGSGNGGGGTVTCTVSVTNPHVVKGMPPPPPPPPPVTPPPVTPPVIPTATPVQAAGADAMEHRTPRPAVLVGAATHPCSAGFGRSDLNGHQQLGRNPPGQTRELRDGVGPNRRGFSNYAIPSRDGDDARRTPGPSLTPGDQPRPGEAPGPRDRASSGFDRDVS